MEVTYVSADDPLINKEANDWIRFGMRLGVSAALHPFEYAKVLMQLGYEPIAPRPGTSFFGKPVLVLPNIFQYAGYIRKIDGFYGCYRGLAPKLLGSCISMYSTSKLSEYLGLPQVDEKDRDNEALSDEQLYQQFKINLKRDLVINVTGIIVSHPFHVVSLRMMAQFIGQETVYSSILGSFREIFRSEGILGFFAGLIPKLLGDIACLVLSSSTVYLINKYVIKDKIGRQYNAGFVQFAFSSILYPLQVVATCMAVSGARIIAGHPPIMPEYRNSLECWNDLQTRGELKRGSSLFWRTVGGFNKSYNRRANDIIMPMPALKFTQ